MLEKNKTCAFTGYRPEKMPYNGDEAHAETKHIKSEIKKAILSLSEQGFCNFITGMSRGFDIWAAEVVLSLQDESQDKTKFNLISALPFIGQDAMWSNSDKERFDYIIRRARYTFCLSDALSNESYFKRNRFLVDNSSYIITYFDGKVGGTKYTINYARKNGLQIINIADNQLSMF